MSARPGRSKGLDARRIIGAGGAVGAFPECGMASPAVVPPARADVIDDSVVDLDEFDIIGGGTFDTLGGSTAARFGDAWGMLDPITDFSAQLPGRDLIGNGRVVRSAGQGCGSGGLIGLAGSSARETSGESEGTAVPVVRGPSAPPEPTAARAPEATATKVLTAARPD